jgi:glycosyltransferase involved in cell wall biosynthesis
MRRTKVLYVVHNHPAVRPGGAEGYALELYEALRTDGSFEPILVARVGPEGNAAGAVHPGTRFGALNADPGQHSVFTHTAHFDFFWMTSRDKTLYTRDFRRFLLAHRPDVVHFQHTHFIGYDLVSTVRQTLPDVPIVYTLHEFLPICHRNGQMLRVGSDEPCLEASPRSCHECFPAIPPQDFFMRAKLIQAHLEHVDRFLCPSRFLLERYADWGLPRAKMRHLNLGRSLPEPVHEGSRSSRARIGFFGQVNHYKGVNVLLDAMGRLVDDGVDAHCWLFGANLDIQPEAFQAEFRERFDRVEARVTMVGHYRAEDLPRLMAGIDWVVVPSIWWENRPLVIQEAHHYGRPVLCSDIGGMAEHVKHEVDGLHFRAGDPQSLASTLERAIGTPGLWDRLRRGIAPVPTIEDHAAELGRTYLQLLEPITNEASVT